jgi:hypothetical protein
MALDILVVDESRTSELVAAFWRTRAMRPVARPAAARRWPRSPTDGRRWCCSTSGCKAPSSTAFSFSRDQAPRSQPAGADDFGPRQSRHGRRRDPAGRGRLHREAVRGRHLLHLVARATETDRLRRENESLRAQIGQETELTGSSVGINAVRATLKRVAGTGSRVLITGPAGVGKEVAARLLHNWSARAKAPFIVVSAARMTPERVEEDCSGWRRGVNSPVQGLVEQAHGGTLSLTRSPTCRCPHRARSCAC